jgi:2-phospho-L-lactate guanylyltransferase
VRWTVVVPVKTSPTPKSRLLSATADADAHHRLVAAMRADTLAAARAADGVARLLIVTDRPGLPDALVQQRPGLNPALTEAAEHAARTWPADAVAALVGDLPALLPTELAAALAAATAHRRSFVPDAAGTGTTLLTACPGTPLAPAFGADSAARHGAAAAVLDAGPGLRCDVDTEADLQAAVAVGLGPATAAVLGLTTGFAH